jgi:flagellin
MAGIDVTRIAGNIGALNALNSLSEINNQLAVHQTRLATGKRLNESADDSAGLLLATTFDVRRQGLQTTLKSIGDSKNLMSTMEGGLRKVQDILVKMRNKSLEAKGDTIGSAERTAVQNQLRAYASEIDDIVKQTQWNGVDLLSGTSGSGATTTKTFLTGPDVAAGNTSTFNFAVGTGTGAQIKADQGFRATTGTNSGTALSDNTGLGLDNTALTIASTSDADTVAKKVDVALTAVKEGISQIGSFTARLTFKEESLTVAYTNTEAAYNRIMNANMAEEQVAASKSLILQQTATAMLSQANTSPQFLLSLFR